MNADTFINNMLGEIMYQIVNGQEALPDKQKENLKDKMPFKDSNFFTWCTPGIPCANKDFLFLQGLRKPVDYARFKDLPEADKESAKGDEAYSLTIGMDNFSLLVDTVPSKTGMINSMQVWEPQQRISHMYESVLKGCEVADTVPSADAQERIKKIREATVETVERIDSDTQEKFTEERPSRMVMAYNKYMQEYANAYSNYIDLMSRSLTGNAADVQKASTMGPQYYKAVTAAYDTWVSAGHKVEFEKLMADLVQLEGISMSLLLKEYREIFIKSQRESLLDSSVYNVSRIVPASFADSTGWTQFSFKSSNLKKTDTSKSKKYSGGARYGIFGGARASHERIEEANLVDFENVEMSFEIGQFPIIRNWFREDFLMSTKWRIKSSQDTGSAVNPGDILSNGNVDAPDGKLFAYPTVILFARNIKISKTAYDKISAATSKKTSGGGGFSIGPFSAGGKASYGSSEKNLEVKQEQDKMVVPGMQIIGFRNHILPLCPNPDPSITKWI